MTPGGPHSAGGIELDAAHWREEVRRGRFWKKRRALLFRPKTREPVERSQSVGQCIVENGSARLHSAEVAGCPITGKNPVCKLLGLFDFYDRRKATGEEVKLRGNGEAQR